MALLDVTEILGDPDFCDTGTCVRRAESVGSNGLASYAETRLTFVGVFEAGSGNRLARGGDSARISGGMTVYTRFRLIPGEPGRDADVIEWGGNTYTVTAVADWSNFGAGYITATCELIQLQG